ncbi:MAG TPA: hypothetical protein VHV83_04870, partial [Armatimonadota bacterium]|nr:hypothetical protein [Armatimonadota bacterium]
MKRIFVTTLVMLCFLHLACAQEKPLVDTYGQYLDENWSGKVTTDAQLKADAAKERPLLANVKFDSAHFDQYGGKLEGKPLAATGYFRTQKIDGRWWLITPLGNRFYMHGADAVGYTEGGYFTPLVNPDGSKRTVFQELPDKAAFPEAYSKSNRVNFIAANLQRK